MIAMIVCGLTEWFIFWSFVFFVAFAWHRKRKRQTSASLIDVSDPGALARIGSIGGDHPSR
jgi:hypothetical protein